MVVHKECMFMLILKFKGFQNCLMEFIQRGVGADLNMPVAAGSKGDAEYEACQSSCPLYPVRKFFSAFILPFILPSVKFVTLM